jgi:L,D-transpeptidase catalytic domain
MRHRDAQPVETVAARPAGEPIMAIVSLSNQRVTIYDADGWILRAPVSSGQTGYETPAGVYSVIQKEEEHYSNLYDDASMPFMQRITWSGIALHAGPLPGYPASHGCVRMPHEFAQRFFDMTTTIKAHSQQIRCNASPASLIGPGFSLIGAGAFPVPVSRELVKQGADFATINLIGFRPLEPFFGKIPCIFPVSRNLASRRVRGRLRRQPGSRVSGVLFPGA